MMQESRTRLTDFCQQCFYSGNFEPAQNESQHMFCSHRRCPPEFKTSNMTPELPMPNFLAAT